MCALATRGRRRLTAGQRDLALEVDRRSEERLAQEHSAFVVEWLAVFVQLADQAVVGGTPHHTGQALEGLAAGEAVEFAIRFPMNLGAGTYSVSTALVSSDTHLEHNYEWRDLALIFTVANLDKPVFVGSAWVPPVIEVRGP